MARIAFILLTHKDPDGVIRQAEQLTASGDFVSIHFDARASDADYDRICAALASNKAVSFARRRQTCGWGEWSLVAATLEAVKAALTAFPNATHFYLLSGDCLPIKTAEHAHGFLDAEDADYIESVDFHKSGWIRTGFREERLIYRHLFNERTQKRRFYASYSLQKRLGLVRRPPEDLRIMIGSQWWCLRRATIQKLLSFCKARPDVLRFFRTTWIPDETFFQTLVRHLVPGAEIQTRSLTFLLFTDYGMPVTFYNDHRDFLIRQDCLFARKISPEAAELRTALGELWRQRGVDIAITDEGRALFEFLTGRGRVGRRSSQRVWETEASLGRERRLKIVVCKKWHVAKRFAEQARQMTGIPSVEYLFNEPCVLPDLGGIEGSMTKRNRHRRALVRMLFEHYDTDRLLICLDPSSYDLIEDFVSDRADIRILEIGCEFSDAYLHGHARRVGLAGEGTPEAALERLTATIRRDVQYESGRIRDADFPSFSRIRELASPEQNAQAISRFLGCDPDIAYRIASTEYLFDD